MNNSEHIDWEENFKELDKFSKEIPFSVPEGYFETSKLSILSQVQISEFSTEDQGFKVPEGFFATESDTIIRKVSYLSDTNQFEGFTVPVGYFEALTSKIETRIIEEATPTKKILKVWTSQFMKYAAAACFIVVTATALYFNTEEQKYIASPGKEYFFNEEVLYDIDVETIIEHVDYKDASTISTTISNSETEDYLLSNYSSAELISEY